MMFVNVQSEMVREALFVMLIQGEESVMMDGDEMNTTLFSVNVPISAVISELNISVLDDDDDGDAGMNSIHAIVSAS